MNAQSMDTPEIRELLKAIYSAVFISDDAVGLMKFLSQEIVEDLKPERDFLPANIVEILTACTKKANVEGLEAIERLTDLLLGGNPEPPLFTSGEAFSIFKEPPARLPEGWMDETAAGGQQKATEAPESDGDARGKPKLHTRTDGALFACSLLDEMHARPPEEECYCCDSDYTKKQPDNIILRYVTELQVRGTAEALGGFCAVLTDDLGQYAAAEAPSHGDLFRGIINRGNLAA